MKRKSIFGTAAAAALALLVLLPLVQFPLPARAQSAPQHMSATTIPAAQLLQPDELNRMLHAAAPDRPLILQVGSRVMFDEAHIPGAEYAGPGSRPEGLSLLRERVKPLPKGKFIVIYCGCCPWNRCPNIAPAYKLLHDMGFTHVKALYLADNFGSDWVGKGYPSEPGQ